ncbi:hypothetical protein [Psychroflexus sp. MES1-P1E]|uniref:hypothetical protein n=1 Tax=Psychroflexus sp. MES1-P1E TaxID=2058320 RepID=UPI000C796FD9|nr:hypothetical protein [Psychroflexus sp. MES1-P1E]PKG43808.1 hypothetical protein CXF67_03015 [Psychroflexus sp. MES1-P1E]
MPNYLRNSIQVENEDEFYAGLSINYTTSGLEFFNKNETIDLNESEIFEMLKNSTFINSIVAQASVILRLLLIITKNLLDFR